MGLRSLSNVISCLRGAFLILVAVAWAGNPALANRVFHMKRNVWGCVDPNVTPDLNDEAGPHRADPQWVARNKIEGQCVPISTRSLWEPLSADHDGLTYVAYRGATATPGSFWVPTREIDFSTPVEVVPALAAPPPTPVTPPVSVAPPKVTAPPLPQPEATPPAPDDQAPTAEVPGPQPQPDPETVPSPSAEAPAAPSGGHMSSFLFVLAILFGTRVAWVILRKSRRAASPSAGSATNSRTVGSVQVPVSKVNARTALGVRQSAIWNGPGTAVSVAPGARILDGMVYVGSGGGRPGDHDASFIDSTLPVARSAASAGPLGYWPSYAAITPECRRCYLDWLASGKKAPGTDIGYVFLYFYGLERRLLLEEPPAEEVQALVDEVERLRAIYASNKSFDGYSRRLIEAVSVIQTAKQAASTARFDAFAGSAATRWPGEMPFALKVAIAREVTAGRPLGFDLATAALFCIRDFWSTNRHVLEKARPVFLALLRTRFATAFPNGFLLRNRKDSHLQFVYQGASAGLHLDLAARLHLRDLPDPTTLTWTKLLNLANAAASDIGPYAKLLVAQPDRANALAGLIGCSPELRDVIAPAARHWLTGLPSPAAVTFGELAGHAIGTETGKWTLRHRRDVSEVLAVLGYAMEPDPEDGTERLEDDTVVQVFRCSDRTRSRALTCAYAAAIFVAAVSRAGDSSGDVAAKHWLSELPSRLTLTPEETIRLRARLAWFGTKGIAVTKAKSLLGGATQDDKALWAWSATVAAGASGDISKQQIATLEVIYDALGVPRGTLYAGLHAGIGAAATAAAEPVLMSDEVHEVVHPIASQTKAGETVKPASNALDRIRAETEQLDKVLAAIFVDDESGTTNKGGLSLGGPTALDAEHTALLARLQFRSEWTREEFDRAATDAGLMPGGAMETINEWAFDHYGEALLDDGDPVVVNLALMLTDDTAAN